MKNLYFVLSQVFSDKTRFASVIQIPTNNNILSELTKYRSADIIHYCSTRKSAEETAYTWNQAYKNNSQLASWETIAREG